MGIENTFRSCYIDTVRYGFMAPGRLLGLKQSTLLIGIGHPNRPFEPASVEGIFAKWHTAQEAERAVKHTSLKPSAPITSTNR